MYISLQLLRLRINLTLIYVRGCVIVKLDVEQLMSNNNFLILLTFFSIKSPLTMSHIQCMNCLLYALLQTNSIKCLFYKCNSNLLIFC